MKAFSAHWKSSKQPRKQRKYRFRAPLHVRHAMMAAPLSKALRKKYKKRNMPVRKGDRVRIMVGKHKKQTGVIGHVDLREMRITIEGIQVTRKDGTSMPVPFQPSNLEIIELVLTDKKRMEVLQQHAHQAPQ